MKTVKSGTAIIAEPKRTAQKGEPMIYFGTEKKQCFDDNKNGSLIMNDEKCGDCEHRYECRFMYREMNEVIYGLD